MTISLFKVVRRKAAIESSLLGSSSNKNQSSTCSSKLERDIDKSWRAPIVTVVTWQFGCVSLTVQIDYNWSPCFYIKFILDTQQCNLDVIL